MGKTFTRFEVREQSMAPALRPGDFLVVRKPRRPIRRGEIVVYRKADRYLVKRVIALGGEHISITGGVISVNQAPVSEPWWEAATRPDGEWDLPSETFFAMGDNRPFSTDDSRTIGPVPVANLVGIAVFCYWPPRRIARLSPSPRSVSQ